MENRIQFLRRTGMRMRMRMMLGEECQGWVERDESLHSSKSASDLLTYLEMMTT